MTVVDEYENVDVVFGEPQDSEGRVYIPMFDIRRVSGAALNIMDTGKLGDEGEGTETAPSIEEEETKHVQRRLLAYIEVGAEGMQILPILDRKRVVLGAVLLSSWIVGWVSAALLSIFRQEA